MATAADPRGEGPKSSADVVEVKLVRHTLADGLECFFVELKVAKGWHVHATWKGGSTTASGPSPTRMRQP
ncbi:MAG: hypothetical protein L0241_26245 [Planctomycetia bacterium]|nr:hypothetical protein [Planctomycetia bacterium]